jgi:hypothetical protein
MDWRLIRSTKLARRKIGLFPPGKIHCFECGNCPHLGAASFHSSICCLLSDKGESENIQSKLISFTKLW